jgi:hypothetical protein
MPKGRGFTARLVNRVEILEKSKDFLESKRREALHLRKKNDIDKPG